MVSAAGAVGAPDAPDDLRGFVHTALAHDGTQGLVDVLSPFVLDGLAARDEVFVNLSVAHVEALKEALGTRSDRVRWSHTTDWHPHPASRLRAIQELVDGHMRDGSGKLRFIGECAFEQDRQELVTEWERFDSVLNEALADAPIVMVCAYDVGALSSDRVQQAYRSHPSVGLSPPRANPSYVAPATYLASHRVELSPIPLDAARLRDCVTSAQARALVRQVLGAEGAFDKSAIDDAAVVVTEAVSNASQSGATEIEVACWRTDAEAGIEVSDNGPGLRDPLAGYRRPVPGRERGRGLWITRQMVDVLDIRADEKGTSLRASMFGRDHRNGSPMNPASTAMPTISHAT